MSGVLIFLLVIVLIAAALVLRRRAVVRRRAHARLDPGRLGLEVVESGPRTRSLRGIHDGHSVEVDLRRDSTRVHVDGSAHIFSAREELGRLVPGEHTPRRVRQALEETTADEGRIWSGVMIEADGTGVLVRREGSRGDDFWPHYLRLAERLVDIRPGS